MSAQCTLLPDEPDVPATLSHFAPPCESCGRRGTTSAYLNTLTIALKLLFAQQTLTRPPPLATSLLTGMHWTRAGKSHPSLHTPSGRPPYSGGRRLRASSLLSLVSFLAVGCRPATSLMSEPGLDRYNNKLDRSTLVPRRSQTFQPLASPSDAATVRPAPRRARRPLRLPHTTHTSLASCSLSNGRHSARKQ